MVTTGAGFLEKNVQQHKVQVSAIDNDNKYLSAKNYK